VLVGSAFGETSPVKTYAPTVYLDVQLKAGASFVLPALAPELAVYAVDGDVSVDGTAVPAHTMAFLQEGAGATLHASADLQLVVIGGEPLDGPRYITWNFVSSRRERILQAGADWSAQRMGHVPGETEFIPLPGHPFGAQEPDVKSTPV
jgi:redox-sensitive bicupin YhaK (pirin superfamily)